MASVAAGSKLLVLGGKAPMVLRSLRGVDLEGGWTVPVLGDVAALEAAGLTARTALVEFPTEHGPIRLDAEVVTSDGSFVLRAPSLRPAAIVEQRRENVRGFVLLPLRGTLLPAAAAPDADVRPGAGSPSTSSSAVARTTAAELVDDEARVDLLGVTRTISGGGISAELRLDAGVAPGSKIYVELGLPGGELAPAVMTVLEYAGVQVRARFLDISPLDRERLVRLVFTRQRAELAERRIAAGR